MLAEQQTDLQKTLASHVVDSVIQKKKMNGDKGRLPISNGGGGSNKKTKRLISHHVSRERRN